MKRRPCFLIQFEDGTVDEVFLKKGDAVKYLLKEIEAEYDEDTGFYKFSGGEFYIVEADLYEDV